MLGGDSKGNGREEMEGHTPPSQEDGLYPEGTRESLKDFQDE